MDDRKHKILLVQMPWATTQMPSIAIGILSNICKENDMEVKAIYPNMDMAHLIGFDASKRFSDQRILYGLSEHLFAADIFGIDQISSNEYLYEFTKMLKDNPTIISKWEFPISDISYLLKLRDEIIPEFLENVLNRVLEINPTVVGFSATFNQVMPGIALANRIKKARPDIRIIAGGASYDGIMGEEYHRALPNILDNVFIGEGEISFSEFVQRLKTGKSIDGIPGLTNFKDGKVNLVPGTILNDMNLSPIPDYDDFFEEVERMKNQTGKIFNIKKLAFEGSRGCWWGNKSQCLFCGVNPKVMQYRPKKVERIISDIVNLSERYKCTKLSATDLVIPIEYCEELFRKLKKLDLDIDLFYEVRVNMSKKNIKDMYDAGIKNVQPGIESFSTPVLKIMKKGTSSLQNIQFLRWISEIGIQAVYNIICGFPGEKEEWYFNMADLIKKIKHLPNPKFNLHPIEMHRFSPYFEKRDIYGVDNCSLRADYGMNFPQGLIDPMKIGYFFNTGYSGSDMENSHFRAVRKEIGEWIDIYNEHKQPIFKYEIGPGFLKIQDSRFGKGRFVHLSGIHHDIVLLCDEIQSRTSLKTYLSKNWSNEVSGGQLDSIIDELILKDIIIEENEQLLTLPIGVKFRDTDELKNYVLG